MVLSEYTWSSANGHGGSHVMTPNGYLSRCVACHMCAPMCVHRQPRQLIVGARWYVLLFPGLRQLGTRRAAVLR